MRFSDRAAAGRALAKELQAYRNRDALVLGLPRGGVVVAWEVAQALDAPLDIIVVRKLGAPWQPELALGALAEGGVRVIDEAVMRATGASQGDVAAAEQRERPVLDDRVARLRGGHPVADLRGRTVVIVDDGIATGSTAKAACLVARASGAEEIVLAVPVAPTGVERDFAGIADALVVLREPVDFAAVGQYYRDFDQVSDAQVARILASARSRA